MIRIGIVEDDPASRTLIRDYLTRYETESGEHFSISVFEDGAQLTANYRPEFDILLLDIQMTHMDGLTAARHVRECDEHVIIIFITSAPQFAIKGYEVNALSYLLKPLPWFAFSQELSRSIDTLRRRTPESLLLRSGTDVNRISIAGIYFIESRKHLLTAHTATGNYTITSTLKELVAELSDKGFFRSNSCYLVNLDHVIGVQDQDCIMSNGEALRISRPRKKAFLQTLSQRVGRLR